MRSAFLFLRGQSENISFSHSLSVKDVKRFKVAGFSTIAFGQGFLVSFTLYHFNTRNSLH